MCHFCFEARLEYHPTAHQPHRAEQTVGCRPRTYPLHNLPKGPTELLDKPLPHSNKIRTLTSADVRKAKNDSSINGKNSFGQTLTLSRGPSRRPWSAIQTRPRRPRAVLGTLQLHGNGGRGGTALGRACSDNRRDVERLGNVVLKERACLLEHLKRQVLKIAAALLAHQDQMAHHGVCLAERQATLSQVIGNIGSGKVSHAALARMASSLTVQVEIIPAITDRHCMSV